MSLAGIKDRARGHRTARRSSPVVSSPSFLRIPYRLWILLGQLAIGAGFLLAWSYASGHWVNRVWISTPHRVADKLSSWLTTGSIFSPLAETLRVAAIGLALGAIAGIIAALVVAQVRDADRVLAPVLGGLYAIPQIAFLPLYIIWFGIGSTAQIALVAPFAFFTLYFNTMTGVRSVDHDLRAALTVMNANRQQMARYAVIPWVGSYIISGFVVAIPYCVVAAMVAEMFVGATGLGFQMSYASSTFDTTTLLAGAFVITLTATGLSYAVAAALNATPLGAIRKQGAYGR